MRRPNRTPIPRVAARETGPTGRRYQARDATKDRHHDDQHDRSEDEDAEVRGPEPGNRPARPVECPWGPLHPHRSRGTDARSHLERTTGFEPATPTLARLSRTSCPVLADPMSDVLAGQSYAAGRVRTPRNGVGREECHPKCHPTRELLADHESHDQGCPWGGFLSPLNTSLDRRDDSRIRRLFSYSSSASGGGGFPPPITR
jgi:hypothetical protein